MVLIAQEIVSFVILSNLGLQVDRLNFNQSGHVFLYACPQVVKDGFSKKIED